MDKSNKIRRLAAALTAGVMTSSTTGAFAQQTFADVSKNVITSAAGLPQMIETVAYVGGIGLGVAGVFKLKNHVDNPAQHPMKDGLVRLGAGGGLLALPYLTQTMAGSINNGQGNQQFSAGLFSAPTTTFNGG